jgi:hypothetical protein
MKEQVKHKHCEAIKKWAEGAEIEYYDAYRKEWRDSVNPIWSIDLKYRVKESLPKTWEELKFVGGYCVTRASSIVYEAKAPTYMCNRNILPTRELAEAYLALAQLLQLREWYNEGWTPDWTDDRGKYSIEVYKGELSVYDYMFTQMIFTFKTSEIRDMFLENFKDLLEIAKPLL